MGVFVSDTVIYVTLTLVVVAIIWMYSTCKFNAFLTARGLSGWVRKSCPADSSKGTFVGGCGPCVAAM